jgi:hypothetical protein
MVPQIETPAVRRQLELGRTAGSADGPLASCRPLITGKTAWSRPARVANTRTSAWPAPASQPSYATDIKWLSKLKITCVAER